jgi:hypothetical protein
MQKNRSPEELAKDAQWHDDCCGYTDGAGVEHQLSDSAEECGHAVDLEDMERIVACVNFCQHLPTETIVKLTEQGIGPATVVALLRKRGEDDCLLKRVLDATKGLKP